MKAFLCELILSCVIAAPGAKPVDELSYGTLLYSYYQEDYAAALLAAVVAEAQGRRGTQPVRFELAAGSFAFSDGMYSLATRTFAAVDAAELTDLDRLRLSFHLARELYRRQDWDALAAELAKIDLGKSWLGREKFHPEVEFMRAELAVERGQFAEAESSLARLEDTDPLKAYGLFNLGVAFREAADLDSASRVFRTLSGLTPHDEESFDLVHRARLALSFVAREQHATADAAEVLGALPGQGRYRDIALASYGGLAMENQDYALAARIWLTLQNEGYWTTSTAQARLAFPVSLERMASEDMALAEYRAAEQSFEARLATLTALGAELEDPARVRGLLEVFAAPERNPEQMSDLVERWQSELGHTDWLEWLADEATHKVLLEWRDLLGMQSWLDELPERLSAYEELAGERKRRAGAARDLLHDDGFLDAHRALGIGVDAQRQRLEALRSAPAERTTAWMDLLANDEERALVRELADMRAAVDGGMGGREATRWLSRVERLEGILFWQIVESREERIRLFEKQLRDNERALAEVDEQIARVQTAEADFSAGVETDFLVFADRAESLRRDVDRAIDRREVALAGQLRRGLAEESGRLEQYLLITRIGIARATDKLALASERVGGE